MNPVIQMAAQPAARRGLRAFALVAGLLCSLGAHAERIAKKAPGVADGRVAMTELHVVGNQIQNGAGQALFLHGINRAGMEVDCTRGQSFVIGISGQPFVDALRAWNANVVRIPLNEDCWLGVNGDEKNAHAMGAPYRKAIAEVVTRLTSRANNLAVILDLHWSAPGTALAIGQQPMPDADHSVAFWRSVAATFAPNRAVVFDLYNEPYPNYRWGEQSPNSAWECWLNGGASCVDPAIPYTAAGMQSLVDAVRGTGAKNLILVAGLQYANEMSRWLAYRPSDPLNNLAAAWHSYHPDNFCSNEACWSANVTPVMEQVPVVVTEFGAKPVSPGVCDVDAVDALWKFLEAHRQGYLAWTWNAWNKSCWDAEPWVLIADEKGAPTDYGALYQTHVRGLPWSYPAARP